MIFQVPKPIIEYDDSNKDKSTHEYPAILRPIDNEIKELYLEDCKYSGFVPGAVVVNVRTPITERTKPQNWGIITEFNEVRNKGGEWKPVMVRWVNGSCEDCHPKDIRIMLFTQDLSILRSRATHNEY